MSLRWYFAYALIYRDIEELMKERGIDLDHSAIQRWVVEYGPQLANRFHKKKRPVGKSWRMDETYIKIKGQWFYQYRAVDKEGKTVDCLLSKKRNTKAAKRFFKKVLRSSGRPSTINIDKSGANTAGIKAINAEQNPDQAIIIRKVKYLNNIVEQDHRFIKKIVKPMKGFKCFNSESATLQGIELHHALRKKQHVKSNEKSVWSTFYDLAQTA